MRNHKVVSAKNGIASGAENTVTSSHYIRDLAGRFIRNVGRKVRTSFAILGVAAAAGIYYEYKSVKLPDDDDKEKKKLVLVIPFHRLDLKDKHDRQYYSSWFTPDEERSIEMDVRELVDAIHAAAADPNIVALYGIFGHGSVLPQTGWADLEEVRSALKVFRETHRVHSEPNLSHHMHQVIKRLESKPLYAYTDTFSSMGDPGNKEYYLASIFTHIHMQEKGDLNLFGILATQFFVRDLLEKYGIKFHVFKHGQYKNAPNMFTETKFTRAHRENVENIVQGLNQDVCTDITFARSKALLASWLQKRSADDLWKRIHESGTFPPIVAWKAGFIDFLPRRDPLPDLLASNKSDEMKGLLMRVWNAHETDLQRFKADKAISLESYAKKLRRKKEAKEKLERWGQRLKGRPLLGAFASVVGTLVGVDVPNAKADDKKEKIALLYVQDGIGDRTARKTVNAIRKIREDNDTKCVVVRVTSPGGSIFSCEAVAEELKSLGVPVVFSFGNVAASGGYYIASAANRIFASHKTITGSIGVFGVRADLTGLGAKYGVKAQHVASGDLSGEFDAWYPMSRKMKRIYWEGIDRYYEQFKGVVSSGRSMAMEEVENIAQGRVWTGEQAKQNGLVDELGGLHRAIAYARRSYTETDADLVVWPKKLTFWERLREARDEGDATPLLASLLEWLSVIRSRNATTQVMGVSNMESFPLIRNLLESSQKGLPGTIAGFYFAADENTAMRCLVDGLGEGRNDVSSSLFPIYFWE